MEKTKIQQIGDRFLNKENYELQIRLCIDKVFVEYTDALNSLKKTVSNDKIKVLKVLMGVNEFQTKIDKQINELKSHYNSRLDIVGSTEHKAEYIYLENEKINGLITSIHKIIASYGINKISFKADVSAIGKIIGKQLPIDNDVSNGILGSLVDFTENFLNNTDAISNAIFNSPIFEQSTDQILVENIVRCIKKINTVSLHILENNQNVFDDTYRINGNGFITKLTKVAPKGKTENTLPKSETEIYNLKEHSKATNDSTEPNNKYPSVFKNGYAFEMFIELKDLTVKPTTILADYSFIFHKMKGYGYIGKDVKHKTFIDIINKKFDAGISAEKFAFKDQEAKKIVFSTLLNKYKPLIDSTP